MGGRLFRGSLAGLDSNGAGRGGERAKSHPPPKFPPPEWQGDPHVREAGKGVPRWLTRVGDESLGLLACAAAGPFGTWGAAHQGVEVAEVCVGLWRQSPVVQTAQP